MHPGERDSHFNPVEKVAFERALTAALLERGQLYGAQVDKVSTAILRYLESRLADGVTKGLADARQKLANIPRPVKSQR